MSRFKKIIYVTLGLIAFTLGFVGVLIPVLPTTPFLLLASFCFVRGSERFDRWFKSTNIYKKHLESFVNEKAMTLKKKVSILLLVDFMIAFPLIILDSIIIKAALILLILVKYYYFMFRIETKKPENQMKKSKKNILRG